MNSTVADVVPAPLYSMVVVAASAGGLAALARILSALPATFSLPVAVVQHVDPNHQSMVADILARRTHLRVKEASSGDLLLPGAVYVAPAGQHMLIGAGLRVQLSRTDPVHFLRPSADHLFESAAKICGPIIGVILTGTGTDGAAGVEAIKAAGGTVIAQDEASSEFFGMPHAAIGTGVVDFVLPLDSIGPALVTLTQRAE